MQNKKEVNWGPAIVLITYHILLLFSLPVYFYYNTPSLNLISISVVLLYLTGLSITGGYHRLYSHRSYRAHPIVEAVILFFGAMAGQGSALRWAFDHRLHHAHVDTDNDPYSIEKGFLYAHFLWILEKPRKIDSKVVPDLLKNKLVMFQHRFIELLMVATNVMAVLIVGGILNDYWGAFFIALWLRLFSLHHFTWFINSLAHTWGDKPFSQEQSAVDNYFLSILTFGEGYHNYHHTFANDYRNGVRWFHFDPTKWLIWTLHKLGLASDLKKMSPYAIKRKMVLEHKNLLLTQIQNYWNSKTDELERQVNEMSERIVSKISDFSQLKERYYQIKHSNAGKDTIKAMRQEIRLLKLSLREDWREWMRLSQSILDGQPELVKA
ncbi:MAG: fatty acid desaturase [Parachlamydiaceae bacterium]|nr:fatty acid desaturase [Parachlamydiaceae bacterium]